MTNPYVVITIDVAALFGSTKGKDAGHAGVHTGPVWTPDHNKRDGKWGDIIPPAPGLPNGQNWTETGKAIWLNGCEWPKKVTICQARRDNDPPYRKREVFSVLLEDELSEHAGYDAPVWRSGADAWGDIIPPKKRDGIGDGVNWNDRGRQILDNDCKVPAEREPDPKPDPEGDRNRDPKPDPEGDRAPDPEEPQPNGFRDPDPDPAPEPEPEPGETDEPDPSASPEPETSPDPDSVTDPDPDPSEPTEPDPGVSPEPDPDPDPEPTIDRDGDPDKDDVPNHTDYDDDGDKVPDYLDRDNPETPVKVRTPDDKPSPDDPMVARINVRKGTVTSSHVVCDQRGRERGNLCNVRTTKRKIVVEPLCTDRVTVSITVYARTPGYRPTVETETFKVPGRPFEACAVRGRG